MANDLIFSWAEKDGRMVHVRDVQKGLGCGCICPYCHEPLMARQGEVREHHFAHHGDNRGANLKICYMVILYKLAEQIIMTEKRICTPSYYGIFPKKELKFVDVKIDGCFEREDKQPDVIAITEDNKEYLIEFTFAYKVRHNKAIDYKNLNCLEIDLSEQTLESLKDFLLNEDKGRKWLNNQDYFDGIIPRYRSAKRYVVLKDINECNDCELLNQCIGAKVKNGTILEIENSGRKYRLCKPEAYHSEIEAHHQKIKEEEERRLKLEEQTRRQRIEQEKRYRQIDASRENQLDQSLNSEGIQYELPTIKLEQRISSEGISRFVYYVDGSCKVFTDENAGDPFIRYDQESVAELIIPRINSKTCNVFQIGLVYMMKLGKRSRNCKLCKLYSDHEASYGIAPYCGKPWEYGKEPSPKQLDAIDCMRYNEDLTMIGKYAGEIEKLHIINCFQS